MGPRIIGMNLREPPCLFAPQVLYEIEMRKAIQGAANTAVRRNVMACAGGVDGRLGAIGSAVAAQNACGLYKVITVDTELVQKGACSLQGTEIQGLP